MHRRMGRGDGFFDLRGLNLMDYATLPILHPLSRCGVASMCLASWFSLQGGVGACWMLSAVSADAEDESVIGSVFVESDMEAGRCKPFLLLTDPGPVTLVTLSPLLKVTTTLYSHVMRVPVSHALAPLRTLSRA